MSCNKKRNQHRAKTRLQEDDNCAIELLLKQGRKRPLDTPKRMIERFIGSGILAYPKIQGFIQYIFLKE